MSWSFQIPCGDPSERLNVWTILQTTAEIADPIDRRISAHMLERLSDEFGAGTFGDAIELLTEAGSAGRRELLDSARVECGMRSTGEVDAARDLARARRDDVPPPPRSGPMRDPAGLAWMGCAAEGCQTFPVDDLGKPVPVRARKWWCFQHRDRAAEHDLDDWTGPALTIGPNGLEQPEDEAERAHYQRIDDERKAADEERNRRAQEDDERLRKLEAEQKPEKFF